MLRRDGDDECVILVTRTNGSRFSPYGKTRAVSSPEEFLKQALLNVPEKKPSGSGIRDVSPLDAAGSRKLELDWTSLRAGRDKEITTAPLTQVTAEKKERELYIARATRGPHSRARWSQDTYRVLRDGINFSRENSPRFSSPRNSIRNSKTILFLSFSFLFFKERRNGDGDRDDSPCEDDSLHEWSQFRETITNVTVHSRRFVPPVLLESTNVRGFPAEYSSTEVSCTSINKSRNTWRVVLQHHRAPGSNCFRRNSDERSSRIQLRCLRRKTLSSKDVLPVGEKRQRDDPRARYETGSNRM